MLISKIEDTAISVEELMYLFLYNLIDYEEYTNVLFKLAEKDEEVISIMVNYNVEKGYEEVEQYMNYHVQQLNRELLTAKTIVLLNKHYPLTEYTNLKKIDEIYPLPFYLPYFIYGLDTKLIVDIYDNVLINTTGNKKEDMEKVIDYYEQLIVNQ